MTNLKISFIILIMTFIAGISQAGDISSYTDDQGQTVITNLPVPEQYTSKSGRITSSNIDSPSGKTDREELEKLKEKRISDSRKEKRRLADGYREQGHSEMRARTKMSYWDALNWYKRALDIYMELQNTSAQSALLNDMGNAMSAYGDQNRARLFYKQAIEILGK